MSDQKKNDGSEGKWWKEKNQEQHFLSPLNPNLKSLKLSSIINYNKTYMKDI